MDERRRKFNKDKGRELKRIFIRGIHEFPEQVLAVLNTTQIFTNYCVSKPFVRLMYAIYLHHLDLGATDATRQIMKTQALEPALDVEFRIYYANQISNQRQEV
jgi:hypothetical protein